MNHVILLSIKYCFGLVVILFLAGGVFAQDAVHDEPEKEIQQGLALLKKKNYGEALTKLKTAKVELQHRLGESGESKDLTKLQLVTRLVRVAESIAKSKRKLAPEPAKQITSAQTSNSTMVRPSEIIIGEWEFASDQPVETLQWLEETIETETKKTRATAKRNGIQDEKEIEKLEDNVKNFVAGMLFGSRLTFSATGSYEWSFNQQIFRWTGSLSASGIAKEMC